MRWFWIGIVTCVSGLSAAAQGPPLAPPPPPAPAPPPGPLAEWVQPAPPPKLWTGTAEAGITGADGNSQNVKLRAALNPRYSNGPHFLKIDLLYLYASAESLLVQNRFLGQSRYERQLKDTPWSWFVSGEVEVDEFKAFDLRVAGHTGLAYTWIKDDATLFKTRFGAGGSREIGGPSNEFKPELILGMDYERKLTDRLKFAANLDVFPNVTDFSDYRAEGRLALDLLIDPTYNLSLRMGLLDRYDSTPEGRRANDIEYFATLLWKY